MGPLSCAAGQIVRFTDDPAFSICWGPPAFSGGGGAVGNNKITKFHKCHFQRPIWLANLSFQKTTVTNGYSTRTLLMFLEQKKAKNKITQKTAAFELISTLMAPNLSLTHKLM